MLDYPTPGNMTVPDLGARLEGQYRRLCDYLDGLARCFTAVNLAYEDYKRLYPPRQKAAYAYPAVSDGVVGALYLKKLGREYYYLLSPQNLTLTCTDLSPTVSLAVQAG